MNTRVLVYFCYDTRIYNFYKTLFFTFLSIFHIHISTQLSENCQELFILKLATKLQT